MKILTMAAVALLGLLSTTARAGSLPDLSSVLQPGEWAFVVKPDVQIGSIKVPEKTIKHSKCVSRDELRKNWFAQNEKGCTTESAKFSGHVLVFARKCVVEGNQVTAKGRITIDSSTAYHGEVDSTGTVGGQKLQGHTSIEAHRTGDCNGSGK